MIQKLVAGVGPNDAAASSGADVAETVNQLVDTVAGLEADNVMAFNPLRWGGWVAQTVVGGNIYGCKSSDPLQVYVSGTDLVEAPLGNPINAGAIVSPGISYVIALSSSTILAMVEDADLRFHMFKTSDSAQTWSLVLSGENTHVKTISDRSICNATVNGVNVLFYGEYNFNPAAGGFNPESKLTLWKSLDFGSTWTPAVTWNTAGVNNTRHMHAVRQFVPNGPIYVCFGDTDAQSAIVRWDGVTNWPSNTSWPDLVQSEGLKVYYGRQSARAVDLIESEGRVYWLNDSYSGFRGDATEQAVWSVSNETFDDFHQESQPMSAIRDHAGWLACKDSDERVFFISAPDATLVAGNKFVGVIGSNKAKTSFKMAGAFRVLDSASSSVPYGFFCLDDKFYLTATYASGKGADNTASFELSENEFRGDYETKYIPDTVHPVYWCDYLNGNAANSGINPNVAVADIRNLLLGDKVPYGARIQLMQPFNSFNGATVTWKNNAVSASFQGDPTEPVAIYGYGATKTTLSYPAAGAITTSVFSVTGENQTNARFVDVTLETLKQLRFFDLSQNAGQNNNLSFVRCVVGNPTILSSAIVRCANGQMSAYGSILGLNRDTNTLISTLSAADVMRVTLDDCLMLSSPKQINITNTITTNEIKLYNSKFFGYSTAVVSMDGAASMQLSGWNNVMSTTYSVNAGAIVGGGTVTGKLQDSVVRGLAGNATAFADNCKVGLPYSYDFKFSDYVY